MNTLPWYIGILIQILVGALAGVYFVKVMKRPVLGNTWGAVIVGIIGGVLGGTMNAVVDFLVNNFFAVNFVATLFGGFFLLWLYSKLAHR